MEVIRLNGVTNARDLGGTMTADGYRIRPHMLLRSARLSKITPADAALLRGTYQLSAVIDLRTDAERTQMPDLAIDNVTSHAIPLVAEAVLGITHEEDRARHWSNLAEAPGLAEMYALIVGDAGLPAWRQVFSIVQAERPGSLLWHCTAGKDRAGLVSAMILYALDVPKETIYADYLQTNDSDANHADTTYKMVLERFGVEDMAARVRDMLLAKPEYLDAAFDAMRQEYGSPDGFLEKGCQLSPAARRAMKQHFCEKVQ